MTPDDLMLKRAQKGDVGAFEELIAPFEQRIYQIALRVMGHPEDALDQAQETMLRVYQNLSKFKGNSSLSTWIFRVTTNVCLDELRRRKNKQATSLNQLTDAGFTPVDDSEGPEEAAVRQFTGKTLQEALNALPDEQRAAVVLRDIEGYSYDEIAQMQGANLNTVKSRIARARLALRKILAKKPELFLRNHV